ncbi:MAG TPA: MFS transporter [Acidimicrobiales bacterium]|nr:MFS transporter [Acidimicrobiales bacterium]
MTFTTSGRLPRAVHAIAAGRGISFLGDEVALLAMAFRAKAELGHFGVAAILIAGALPLLVLAPFSGLLVDRVRARPLLVAVTLAQAALCASLAFAPAALLVPLIALLACGTSVSVPAWQALVPTLVTDEQLPGAMGLLQSVQAFAGIAGPFVGGFLVAWYGFHVPLVIDAVSFLVLALIPVVLRVDRVPDRAATPGSSRSEALAGIRLILGNPMLRSIMALVTCFVLAIGAINVVEIYFITTALHAGARGYGLLGASMGIGMLVTAACSGRLAKRFTRPERLFVAGCVGLCVGLLCFGLTSQLWEAVVLLLFVGASNALVNVNAMVLFTRSSTDAIRGRVFSAIQGTVSAAQIAALAIGGLLLFEFAPRPIILVGASASAVALAFTIGPVLRAGRTAEVTGDGVTADDAGADAVAAA